MQNKQSNKWENTRKLGLFKFVLFYGVLYWGVTVGILWSVVMQLMNPIDPWYFRPLIALVLFPIAGIFFGLYMWNLNEKKFKSTK
jgi:hypothetical protein